MPFDLKAIQKQLKNFKTFTGALVDLFQNTPKTIGKFAKTVNDAQKK